MLGLGSNMMKHPVTGKSIVRDGLVLQHNYNLSSVEPLSSGAAFFDGTDDYVAIPTPSVFSGETLNSFDITMSAWANFKTIAQYEAIICLGDFEIMLTALSSTAVGIYVNDSYASTAFTYTPTMGVWNFYSVTKSGNVYSLYVDGVLIGAGTDADNGTVGSASYLGLNSVNKFFDGYMCNVGVWSAALSQAQIKSIMNKNYDSLSASEKTDLVSWWNLDSVIPDTTTLVYDNHHGGGEVLGVELVNCVGFDCVDPAAVWSEQAGWSFSGGKAIYDGTGGTSGLIQSNVIEVGKQYKVIVEVLSNQGSGSNTIYLGGTVLSQSHLSVGTHVFYGATSNTNVSLYIYGRSGEVFEIGSFSAKEINGNTGTLS